MYIALFMFFFVWVLVWKVCSSNPVLLYWGCIIAGQLDVNNSCITVRTYFWFGILFLYQSLRIGGIDIR